MKNKIIYGITIGVIGVMLAGAQTAMSAALGCFLKLACRWKAKPNRLMLQRKWASFSILNRETQNLLL